MHRIVFHFTIIITESFEYRMRAGGYSGVYAPLFADFDGDNKGDLIALGSIPPSGIESNLMFIKGINTGVTSVTNNVANIVTDYSLGQNYPNPFNPTTQINYDLPFDGNVSIKLYDMTGREVMTLINEVKPAGYYTVNLNAANLSSGVYFYTLSANNFTATKKLMVVK